MYQFRTMRIQAELLKITIKCFFSYNNAVCNSRGWVRTCSANELPWHYFQNGAKMEIYMAFFMEISRFGVFLIRNFGFLLACSIFYILSK